MFVHSSTKSDINGLYLRSGDQYLSGAIDIRLGPDMHYIRKGLMDSNEIRLQ